MERFTLSMTVCAAVLIGCSGKPTPSPEDAPPERPIPPASPKAHIRVMEMTPIDWKIAVSQKYPAPLRAGMSDEQLARDLDLQAWAFDFRGGPIRLWLEFDESGQNTMPARRPVKESADWYCGDKEGHIVFWVGRGSSERMKKIMQKLGKDLHPESIGFGLCAGNANFFESHSNEPLWFGWPGRRKTFEAAVAPAPPTREGEAFTLLRVGCVESSGRQNEKPRKATLVLKGAFRTLEK